MNSHRINKPNSRINREQALSFTFDGKSYQGFAGDTLASALLANGVRMIGRSFKYGRPRGIVGHGAEEPNALIQLEKGAVTTPNVKATQVELYEGLNAFSTTGWPSLNFDVKSVMGRAARFMPAGFYYKTFMAPPKMWPLYEDVIRRAAGFGSAPVDPDPEYYDHLHHHPDVLVVGGGACGIWSALIAARAGLRVMLVDEQAEMGGWLLSDGDAIIDSYPTHTWLRSCIAELDQMSNVTRLPRTTAFALHDANLVQAVELIQDHLSLNARNAELPRQRLHKIRANQVILATGALERPLVFGNNDLPGVMTASAGQTYLNRYSVRAGKKVLVMTSNDWAYGAACDLAQAGAEVTLADTRVNGALPARSKAAQQAGVTILNGHGIAHAVGGRAVMGAHLIKLDPVMNQAIGSGAEVACDLLLSSGGLSPNVHLFCHNGSRPSWSEEKLAFVAPEQGRKGISCVGSVVGEFSLQDAIAQTTQVVTALCSSLGKTVSVAQPKVEGSKMPVNAAPARRIFRVPDGKREGHGKKAFVDYQNDVAASDIELAVRENYRSIEHVKRYTGLGFGTDQGKLSNVNGFAIAADALGKSIAEVGTTTYRPAYTPVAFGALAGAMVGDTFDPSRYSAIHEAHVKRDAKFEVVGQWMRPWYFPKGSEDLHAAVNRECLAARNGVGMMDASTLGKIDIRGPDAREFLNRVYSNAWSQLAPGKCRYGLMLDENGMVMDDGVTACLDDQHFMMTTTTGGAARVMSWLERWLQTEWPDLKVYLTSVTDHWSTSAVVGPKSRAVLEKLCTDIDLSADAFKFMDCRIGTVAGVPARVFRISFSGELAYEVNVDASYGHYMWEALMKAGEEFEITPYGTETMHVLRAEKGFIIVGQDTDGSVSPIDLGMAWAVSMKKSFAFLGKRSLARTDTARTDRKQLVGLMTEDPNVVLTEGAQIVESAQVGPMEHMIGRVTSSYHSAFLGRSIAMALVEGGSAKDGQVLYCWDGGKITKAKIVSPVFIDPEGKRQHV
ncbi:sarcosine oxidase subunit alpha family protein [Solimicrobium silvestre]|uniref:SoxA: sarcosine oxidase, alpha subunit family n=1 Tax=Solimicrobium silvestre TaxID=2099400 RepID=A0A2S9GW80_9BURK|nr:sarcosine oxidase subunit alpha family protein [Solimicrobium silvestre]PRC91970.1 soxA: sarcosine oxidase, alpha subunit family [Solimicrobium silvestre]